MPPLIATAIYVLGIWGLFRLDRDSTARTSPALWIPIAWLSIGASRNLGEWFGLAPVIGSPDHYLDGSPFDALVFIGLEVAALMVLLARHRSAAALLRANGPLVVFFLFCAASVLWSDFPLVAFKRWTKAAGNWLMVLVVLTDPEPRAAVKRLLARAGFILVPLSILLTKYYPELGRGFNGWTGRAYNMGVGMDKNALGVICLIFGLASLWRLLEAPQPREGGQLQRGEGRRLTGPALAHGAVLGMSLWLLSLADSATSLGCFLVGAGLLVFTRWGRIAQRPVVVHALAAAVVCICLFGLLIDTDMGLVQAMGRDSTLSTRTELWDDLVRMPVNPLWGTGFESFWLGERVKALWAKHWWRPNQAHNGYFELYLNLGWLGVLLLAVLLVWGYRKIVGALARNLEGSRLRLALFLAAVLYNLTEAAFKVMHPVWIVFLLAVTVVPAPAPSSTEPRRPGFHKRSSRVTTIRVRKEVSVKTVLALVICCLGLGVLPAAAQLPGETSTAVVEQAAGGIVALVGPPPAWLTPGLQAQVLAVPGMPVPAPHDAPLPGVIGIRPGSWMIGPRSCTLNFVFTSNGAVGIGAAGHCLTAVGDNVIVLTLEPGTNNPVLVDIGTVVIRHDNGLGDDFALISIHPALVSWVSPTAAVIGGPCGQYGGSGPEVVMHYGHGVGIGTGGTPRAGLATTWDAASFAWVGGATTGDSGSPVRVTDGKAAGHLTHAVLASLPSAVGGTRIERMLQIAAGWTMVNSPLCP